MRLEHKLLMIQTLRGGYTGVFQNPTHRKKQTNTQTHTGHTDFTPSREEKVHLCLLGTIPPSLSSLVSITPPEQFGCFHGNTLSPVDSVGGASNPDCPPPQKSRLVASNWRSDASVLGGTVSILGY